MFVALTVEPHEHVDRQSDRRDEAHDHRDRREVLADKYQKERTADQLPQDAVDRGVDLLGLPLVVCQLSSFSLNLLSSEHPKISYILEYNQQ